MEYRILPAAPDESELQRWEHKGTRHAPSHSNVVRFVSPNEQFGLRAQVDDPVHGYLIELFAHDRDREEPIGRTIVDDRDLALTVAAEMAAAATDLDALVDDPQLGPSTVYKEDIDQGTLDVPGEYEDEEDDWEDAVEEAYEKAEVPRSKGTLTTKTIDERQYYYLQWRDGEKVRSQYVAPVNPS